MTKAHLNAELANPKGEIAAIGQRASGPHEQRCCGFAPCLRCENVPHGASVLLPADNIMPAWKFTHPSRH